MRSVPLRDVHGDPISAREHVRALTSGHGPVDERVLDDLTVQWRAQVNRELRGTGTAVMGDYIVAAAGQDTQFDAERLEGHERTVGNIVYQTQLHSSRVAQAKLAAMDPRLTVVSTMGIER